MAEEFDDSMSEKGEKSSSNDWDFVGRSRIRCLQILVEDKAAFFQDDEINVTEVQSDIELMLDNFGDLPTRDNFTYSSKIVLLASDIFSLFFTQLRNSSAVSNERYLIIISPSHFYSTQSI